MVNNRIIEGIIKMKIGIDLGGSHIGVGIVNEEGKIVTKKEKDIKIDPTNLNTKTVRIIPY